MVHYSYQNEIGNLKYIKLNKSETIAHTPNLQWPWLYSQVPLDQVVLGFCWF